MCSPFCRKSQSTKENQKPPVLLASKYAPHEDKIQGSVKTNSVGAREVKELNRKWNVDDLSVEKVLGEGSFGRVHLVKLHDDPEANAMALKIMGKAKVIKQAQVDHVLSETKVHRMISHPFIVTLIAAFQDEINVYILMEFVNGGEFFSYLTDQEAGLPNDHARFFAGEIVLALQCLHNLNIVYRDLKPENLLLDHSGHIKVTDFGFAKIVEDRTYTVCGTPEYMAPEIIQSRGHSAGADWWAVGVLVYEMLCGYPPFNHDDTFLIYQQILDGKVEYPKHMSTPAKDLVKRLLKKEQAKRLGCLKKKAEDVMEHKWFNGLDWNALYAREVTSPFVPAVNGPNDASMFNFEASASAPQAELEPLTEEDQRRFETIC